MRSCNGILALKWEDKRDVHIFSTKHEKVEMTEQCKNQFNPTLKPKYVLEYNKVMIGIDRQDQMLACFSVMRKYMKYTQHCLTFMIGRERVHSVRYHVGWNCCVLWTLILTLKQCVVIWLFLKFHLEYLAYDVIASPCNFTTFRRLYVQCIF